MTDNEIIRALECYSCMEDGLHENAIDLIKRQQARIELLTKENDEIFDSYTQSVWLRDKQIKAAIKEFAERLCDKATYSEDINQMVVCVHNIDNLVKEMTN